MAPAEILILVALLLIVLVVVAVVVLVAKTSRGLTSGRLSSKNIADHAQAVEQMDAMRGDGASSGASWDGVDRLGSAGQDTSGGAI